MAKKVKKAKLAHEKKKQGGGGGGLGGFTFQSVQELVEWPAGQAGAIVDLDGKGTLAIVDQHFVLHSGGALKPALMACPAVYDAVARERAIERHSSWTSGK